MENGKIVIVLQVTCLNSGGTYYLAEKHDPSLGDLVTTRQLKDEEELTTYLSGLVAQGFTPVSSFQMSELEKLTKKEGTQILPDEVEETTIGNKTYNRVYFE